MNNMIITFEDGSKREYRKGTKFGEIVEDVAVGREIVCGNYNNSIINYDEPIAKSGKLILYDINTIYGNRVYEKGLTYLFKALHSRSGNIIGGHCDIGHTDNSVHRRSDFVGHL